MARLDQTLVSGMNAMTHSNLKQAAARVDRMATARGLDLQEASMRAGLTPDDIADLVQRCTGCTQPDGCDNWLASHGGQSVSATPGYCRNADMFARLAIDSG
ncbi:MAG: DUF6455 family protein [Pseudomonadota bacterium]